MQTRDRLRLRPSPERFAVVAGSGESPGTVQGYAVRYGPLSSDRGGYRVRFGRGSMRLPEGRDVRALWSHDEAAILGRTGNGTLRLREDEFGVAVELDLPDTRHGRDAAELVRRGDVAGMSFGMFAIDASWAVEDGEEVREVSAYEIDEVTLTGNPAFGETSAQMKATSAPTTYGVRTDENKETKMAADADNAETPKDDRETFAAKKAEAKSLVDAAREENRGMTDAERDQFDSLKGELAAMRDAARDERDLAELEVEQFAAESKAKEVAVAGHALRAESRGESRSERETYAAHVAGVEQYLRTGARPEKFVLTTGTGSGVLLPKRIGMPYLISDTTDAFRQALFARGMRSIETEDSAAFSVPVFDDRANLAVVIAEDSTTELVADPVVSGVALGATLYSSKTIWLSNTAVASMPNLLGYAEPMVRRRIDRQRELAFATKVTGATGGAAVAVTTASASGITFANLLDLQHSLSPADRSSGVFVVSDSFCRLIRGMTDSTGQPIYQASIRDAAPATLLGWPIFVSEQLPAVAAGAKVAVAAAAEGIFYRDVVGGVGAPRIARYVDIPTHPDQTGYCAFQNGDSGFAPSAVRVLKMGA